jgi:hypothetical protein
MWRARVCFSATTGLAGPPRIWSISLTMWKPAGLRRMSLTSPGLSFFTASAYSAGRRSSGRPMTPPVRPVGRIGIAGGHLGEVVAAADLVERGLRPRADAHQLVGRGLLGYAQDDVGGAALRHWRWCPRPDSPGSCRSRHRKPRCGFRLRARAARQDDFLANLLAELGPDHAVPLQRGAEILQGKLVAFRDAAHGGIELDIGYAQPGFLGELQLHRSVIMRSSNCRSRTSRGGSLHLLVAQLALDRGEAGAQFVCGDGFVIDHGD